ncbi:MAG TPA: chromosomal replication initiator protein DnaA [Candidatus Merdousia gallistercoris]|nr:chromosomal replication initiator protein DnaA [Candidatus Merdousia gallistercoris]
METDLTTAAAAAIWERAKEGLFSVVGDKVYESWFSNLEPAGSDDETMRLSADGEFTAIWIRDNYMDVLSNQISLAASHNMKVEIVAREESPQSEDRIEAPRTAPRRISAPKPSVSPIPPSINPRNTFESFVVGESNRFAHAAALAVAQNIGVAFNPLFIYGATGLGKTHLMHAIAHFVLKNNPSAAIAYVSSENFVNEYVAALRDGNIANFRKRYRNTDVLLIDDVQFFAGKERCQEEFFHTFNELFNSGRQIVLSCDKPINEVSDIEQRLVSRFGWGVSVDIQAPDYETRLAILQKKAALLGRDTAIEPAVLELLARKFTKSIRRMEGALTNLIGYASLINSGNAVTLEKANELLADAFCEENENAAVDIDKIQKKTAESFNIDPSEIVGKRRPANIAMARQIAMYLSRKLTTHSLQEIGRQFGGRDHGTVMHAIKVIGNAMENDENIKRKVDYLLKTLSV